MVLNVFHKFFKVQLPVLVDVTGRKILSSASWPKGMPRFRSPCCSSPRPSPSSGCGPAAGTGSPEAAAAASWQAVPGPAASTAWSRRRDGAALDG